MTWLKFKFLLSLIFWTNTSLSTEKLSDEDITLGDILQSRNPFLDVDREKEVGKYNNYAEISFNVDDVSSIERETRTISEKNQYYRELLFEGDIAASPQLVKDILQLSGDNYNEKRQKRQAFMSKLHPKTIWTDGVPYHIHEEMSPQAKRAVLSAVYFWERETCISFYPADDQMKEREAYLLFTHKDVGCWSTIGKDPYMSKQVLSVGKGCAHFGIIVHELAHALGIFHEQSRWDRNDYVRVRESAVRKGEIFNFYKIAAPILSTYDLPYDIGSVMHYAPSENISVKTAFPCAWNSQSYSPANSSARFSAKKTEPALNALDPLFTYTMGQMEAPSFKDVMLINSHYGCMALKYPCSLGWGKINEFKFIDRCLKSEEVINCHNGGYPDPRNCTKCKCPTGFAGRLCEELPTPPAIGCGGTLESQEYFQMFEFQFGPTKRGKTPRRECIFHIQAPANSSLILKIDHVNGKCNPGCGDGRLEIKPFKDYRSTGYRFCCEKSNGITIQPNSSLVPIIISTTHKRFAVKLAYMHISDLTDTPLPTKTDANPFNSTLSAIYSNNEMQFTNKFYATP